MLVPINQSTRNHVQIYTELREVYMEYYNSLQGISAYTATYTSLDGIASQNTGIFISKAMKTIDLELKLPKSHDNKTG